jgi:hypothetical protein
MSAFWVSLELGSLAGLLVLVCVAVFAHAQEQRRATGWGQETEGDIAPFYAQGTAQEQPGADPHTSTGLRGDKDEPEWWPEFEREFALYAATCEATRRDDSSPPRLRPPPQSESA